jgi:hypothetical protein
MFYPSTDRRAKKQQHQVRKMNRLMGGMDSAGVGGGALAESLSFFEIRA